ncbi:MAG: hypothetical protein ABW252_08740 [Polyangiales bacterium]
MRDIVAPLAVALALRLLLVALTTSAPSWDGVIYVRAAEQLARGEGYTQRILHEGNSPHPTAFYPVGYPAVLAVVRWLGGGLGADLALQCACGALLVPLTYLLARRARGRAAGRHAAWLAALWPGGIFLSATWLAEPLFAVGAALSLLPLAYARRRNRTRALVLAALGLGLTSYLRASALPIAALVGLLLGRPMRLRDVRIPRWVAAGALAAGMGAIACLPLAPWMARNARLLGAPVLVSTNDGVNLLLGARGDGSFTTLTSDEPCKRGGLREVERSRCYTAQARSLLAADPFSAGARALLKLAHTYGHDSAPAQCFADGLRAEPGARNAWRLWSLGLCRVAWLLILGAALMGAIEVCRRGDRVARALLIGPIAAIALLHMVFLGGDRYHAAVAPMLLALAGIGLAMLRRRERDARQSAAPAQAA